MMSLSGKIAAQPAPLAGRVVASRVARARVAPAPVRLVLQRSYAEEDTGRGLAEYENPLFHEVTVEAFPEKMVANAEEARVLYDHGYTFFDVRPKLEYDSIGFVRGSVHIPFTFAKKRFVDGRCEIDEEDNMEFEDMVEEKFPNKDIKLLVADSNGAKYLQEVMEILEDLGYMNTVAVRGGFMGWYKNWDNKLNRRRLKEYKEDYSYNNDGFNGDSCGIHASGAGFQNQDACNADFWANGPF